MIDSSQDVGLNPTVRISAKVDYALQAAVEIASASAKDELVSAEEIAQRCDIPLKFLEGILTSLRKAGIVNSFRGPAGGFELAKRADLIAVADLFRAIEGPLAAVRGHAPEDVDYSGNRTHISDVWIATRVSLRHVLENVTIDDILTGKFDPPVRKLLNEKDAWRRRKQ